MNLAFIDHSFHQKTSTTRFLIDLFKEYYNVDILWDESWRGGSRVGIKTLNEKEYDVILFFQILNYPMTDIRTLQCQNVVFVPMFDGVSTLSSYEWLRLRGYRFINFSSTLHRRMQRLGLVSLSVQYFLNPAEFEVEDDFDSLRGFFWQRTNGITWTHIRRLIDASNFSKFHIHSAVDPHGCTFISPSAEDRKEYSISISNWFEDRKGYISTLYNANIYFAPRLYEGIGMSFLEAMTMGKCVIAADHPTMNEYIRHGVEGYLYDLRRVHPVDLSRSREMGKRARESCILGYKKWVDEKDSIIEFVSKRNSRIDTRAKIGVIVTAKTAFYSVQILRRAKGIIKKLVMKCCSRKHLLKQ
jgi:hypothetical protein